ncbi:hypothetical protein AMTRI_Chr13g91620 [Amborella trichopoda]
MGLESKPFEMDTAFIQAPEHRPSLISHQVAEGVRPLSSPIAEFQEIMGFFQVINHGVPIELRTAVEEVIIIFFGFPLPEKQKHTKNVRDWKEVFDFSVRSLVVFPELEGESIKRVTTSANQWPENPPEMRSVCEAYPQATKKLAVRLLELISLSLGLPASRLQEFFKDHTSSIRLNRYPPCPCPNEALGVGRHKDPGALTVLAQDDVGCLEVKRKDGEWVAVKPPVPNSYIINVGDLIQYECAEHRVVVNSKRERFSVPFFYYPSAYEKSPNYLPYNWGHFFVSRKLGNFKKRNIENLQIQHFRVAKLNA